VSIPALDTPGIGPIFFLGWGQRGPRISVRRGWEPLWCDLTGTQIPLDLLYEGQEGNITIELSKYSETTLELLQAMPLGVGRSGTPYADFGWSRGTIMITEGVNPILWLRFPFSAAGAFPHPAMANVANGPLPSGLRFPGAIFTGPDERITGTAPSIVTVTFRALAQPNFSPGAFGRLQLADFDMSAVTGAVS
jgi:hypothetical protein